MSFDDLRSIGGPRPGAISNPQPLSQTETQSQTQTLYANKNRSGLVEQAKVLFADMRQSLQKINSDIQQEATRGLDDLVRNTPILKDQLTRLATLFTHPNAIPLPATPETHPTGSTARLFDNRSFDGIRKDAYDSKAFVLNKGIASEPEQMRLMKATIESANKFAAVTTYGIKPVDSKGVVTNTMHAVLAGLAQKQDDPEFNFVFLYNKSEGLQNAFTGGKRTQVSLNPESKKQESWANVVVGYNRQILDEYNKGVKSGAIQGSQIGTVYELCAKPKSELQHLVQAGQLSGLPLGDLKAKVYMVAADPRGGGSHHNKFAINDSGFAATLGASIGNTSKGSWFDSGAVALSQKLASSQRDYLINNLLPLGKHIGLLSVDGGQPHVEAALKSSDVRAMRETMTETIKNTEIKEPFSDNDGMVLNEALSSGLRTSGFLKPEEGLDGVRSQVSWIQNAGTTIEPTNGKPIKQALEHLFKEAKPGDTIQLRNNAFNGVVQKLALEAIERGVNVQILAPTKTKVHDAAVLFKGIQALQSKVDTLKDNTQAGKLEVHVFNPSKELRDAHDFDPGGRPVNDHAKVYALKRANPDETSVLFTGTHNLDGQSFKRSHENMMFIESKNTNLSNSLFGEFWNATPAMEKDDIDLLVTEFKKPISTSQSNWADQIQHKDALLKKMGLPDHRRG